jgi:hypothetical protein
MHFPLGTEINSTFIPRWFHVISLTTFIQPVCAQRITPAPLLSLATGCAVDHLSVVLFALSVAFVSGVNNQVNLLMRFLGARHRKLLQYNNTVSRTQCTTKHQTSVFPFNGHFGVEPLL